MREGCNWRLVQCSNKTELVDYLFSMLFRRPIHTDRRQCTLVSVKFVFVASDFAFVVVLLIDKDKSECVISVLNYHFYSSYLFIYLGV